MNETTSLSPEVLEFARRVELAKRELLKSQAYLAVEGASPDLDAAARMVATMLSL